MRFLYFWERIFGISENAFWVFLRTHFGDFWECIWGYFWECILGISENAFWWFLRMHFGNFWERILGISENAFWGFLRMFFRNIWECIFLIKWKSIPIRMGRRSHVNRFQKACNRGRQYIHNAPKNVRTSIPQQWFLAKANLPSQPARRPNGGDPATRRSASAWLTPPRARCKLGASGWVVFKYFSWKLFCAQRECALRPK